MYQTNFPQIGYNTRALPYYSIITLNKTYWFYAYAMLELDSGVARLIWVFFHDIHQDPGQMAPSQPREPPRSKVRTLTTLPIEDLKRNLENKKKYIKSLQKIAMQYLVIFLSSRCSAMCSIRSNMSALISRFWAFRYLWGRKTEQFPIDKWFSDSKLWFSTFLNCGVPWVPEWSSVLTHPSLVTLVTLPPKKRLAGAFYVGNFREWSQQPPATHPVGIHWVDGRKILWQLSYVDL